MVEIELHDVTKIFKSPDKENLVLQDINFSVSKGEVVSIRGDNGTGKTTLLNIVAKIETPTRGSVKFGGLAAEVLRVGYTQQDYTSSLLPWLNVIDNVAIPLRLRGVTHSEQKQSAKLLLDSLGFNNLPITSYPHQLSGGQKQRVAVARSLVHHPHLLLLDEPFANLDAHTSRDLQEVLSNIHQSQKPTIIYVSHELDHCIYLADRIIFLHGCPARIVLDIRIPLPRPRKREIIFSPAYAEIRAQVLAAEEALYARSE